MEALIFILHKYYAGLVIETERVFAEVHFTLFFVVIINAIMSSLLYFLSTKVAQNKWFRMEAIDLDHYVAVRKQFDAVNDELKKLKSKQIASRSKKNKDHRQSTGEILEAPLTNKHEYWAKRFWGNYVTKNMLRSKQRELLVQVRFHEMRVHFIESHKLPHNFR